jgi:hypothetical protein
VPPHFRSSRVPLRRLVCVAGVVAAAASMAPRSAEAWRPETQEAIALEAARLAPPDLARQIGKHRRSFLAGVREPLSGSAPLDHMKNADGSGALDSIIAAEIASAVRAIQTHQPFADVVLRMGRVSHWVADANLPLNTANADSDERRYFRDFLDYVETARPRFAVVFYGVGVDWRSPRDVDGWTRRTLARGRKLYPSIGDEYRRIGMVSGSGVFDDRSTAFAVAALAYSHALSDVSRAFRYIWLAAGGGDSRSRLVMEPERLLVLHPGGVR